MFVPNYYVAQRLTEQRLRDCLRLAEKRQLLRIAGLDQQGRPTLWICKLLSRLGRLLVLLGQRLERVAPSPVSSPVRLPKGSGV
jgi:hypothetical protein